MMFKISDTKLIHDPFAILLTLNESYGFIIAIFWQIVKEIEIEIEIETGYKPRWINPFS